jgi:hypothetical protein
MLRGRLACPQPCRLAPPLAPPRRVRRVALAPRASLASHEALPLRDGGGGGGGDLSPALAALRGGGIFAVYDGEGSLRYVGMSRQLSGSLEAIAAAFEPAEAAAAKAQALDGTGAALQAAWKAWILEHGAVPPGNAAGADPRWAAPRAVVGPASSSSSPQAAKRPADRDCGRWADGRAGALITDAVLGELDARGFAVLDGALDGATIAGARRAAEALSARGVLRGIPSQAAQGRRDASAAVALPAPGAAALAAGFGGVPLPPLEAGGEGDAACLASAAALLMALPHALQERRRRDGGGASTAAAAALGPPQSLQLALYAGDGAFYARHVDNPGPGAPGAREGPPGLRTGDRELTAILYLNPDWVPAHGGQLRLWPPAGGGGDFEDLPPLGGRLLLFRSADVDHEVRPSAERRWALSAWIPRADACVG